MKNPTYVPLIAGLLVLAGCSGDNLTAPARLASPPTLYDQVGGGTAHFPTLIPNSVKSSDHGLHPATGRSGSAQLTARALLGKDGYTDLEITTGELDVAAVPPGNLSKVQVKGFDAHDALRSTLNYNHLKDGGYAHYRYTGYARGNTIQVQSNITGIDRRTDVVTVRDMVALRPDLAVTDLTAPETAAPQLPVQIQATVSELNGDVGAHANCVLYVNGAQVDEAAGIWVDAGSHAACVFSHVFAQAGTYTLEVAAQDVTPGDWDVSNNTATRSIVISSGVALQGGAAAMYMMQTRATYDSTGTSAGFTVQQVVDTTRSQQVNANAMATGGLGSLTGMSAVETSGGVSTTTVTSGADWSSDNGTTACALAYSTGGDAMLSFCRLDDGSSVTAAYLRLENQDVFYSRTFYCSFLSSPSGTCEETVDMHTTGSSSSGFTTFGSTVEVRLQAEIGGLPYVADGTIELTPFSNPPIIQPLSCSYPSPSDPTSFECTSVDIEMTGASGNVNF